MMLRQDRIEIYVMQLLSVGEDNPKIRGEIYKKLRGLEVTSEELSNAVNQLRYHPRYRSIIFREDGYIDSILKEIRNCIT